MNDVEYLSRKTERVRGNTVRVDSSLYLANCHILRCEEKKYLDGIDFGQTI
jgi:hypothetical protein